MNKKHDFQTSNAEIENGLEPYRYLTWLIKTANLSQEDTIRSMLPWNAPADCRTK